MKQLYYKIDKCLGCKSCEITCAVAHSENQNLLKSLREKIPPLPRKKILYSKGKNYPVSCRSCKDPMCLDACMAAAITLDREKGVSHDRQRCVGCWMCVMACPYGAIRPDKAAKIPLRCDKCKDKDQPACIAACPTGAIIWEEEVLKE